MMNGWNGGMGTAGWIFMSLFWVLLVGVIIWAAAQLFPGRRDSAAAATGPGPAGPAEQPQQILDRRLASGELDVETYERLRETLAKPGRVS
jgi:putative membrane protein